MTVRARVPQCALSVLSYSEFKLAKVFQHWGGLTALPPPDSPAAQWFFSPRYARRKTGTPKKLLDMALPW